MKAFARVFFLLVLSCLGAMAARDVGAPRIVPADPDAAGKELVARLLALQPADGMTNTATLTNFVRRKPQFAVPLRIEVSVTGSNWTTSYVHTDGRNEERYVAVRNLGGANEYRVVSTTNGVVSSRTLHGQAAMMPIAKSDFTLADVGMEFLHWPTQRVLAREVCRTQSCNKLESIAPPGWTNGYTRVLSWFDIDTGGPVLVEAYDAAGKRVKEFKPNDFKKVNGQWEVEEVEISNSRTDTRSTIRFDLQSR